MIISVVIALVVVASLVIGLVMIGLIATLGLSRAAHELIVLGMAGWHTVTGWFSAHPSTAGFGDGG